MLPTKENCCGCGACANSCSKNAIKMTVGSDGFLYPLIDTALCVECGKCEKSCPFLSDVKQSDLSTPKAYIVQNKNKEILKQSTSGGAFTAIALKTIEQGGVVFGAAIDENFKVRHISVTLEDELKKFRNSKYVQSEIGNTYKRAEECLKDGKRVCFSGTPCQISGLYRYLGKEYDNLITVDVVCRSVPSPMVLEKYVSYQKAKYPQMKKLVFRDKAKGYSYSNVAIYGENGSCLYRGGSEYDPWLRLFLGEYCSRISCYDCKYQTPIRPADFTIWDCWDAHSLAPALDNNKGASYLVARSQKALRMDLFSYLDAVEIEWGLVEDKLKRHSSVPKENRDKFFSDCKEMSADEFIKKYAPITFKIKLKKTVRNIMLKLHFHNAMRRLVHKIRNFK